MKTREPLYIKSLRKLNNQVEVESSLSNNLVISHNFFNIKLHAFKSDNSCNKMISYLRRKNAILSNNLKIPLDYLFIY